MQSFFPIGLFFFKSNTESNRDQFLSVILLFSFSLLLKESYTNTTQKHEDWPAGPQPGAILH